MTSGHIILEIIECLAILIALIVLAYYVSKLRGHMNESKAIHGMLEGIALRSSEESEEILVTQAVILRRLTAIERRMAHGTD